MYDEGMNNTATTRKPIHQVNIGETVLCPITLTGRTVAKTTTDDGATVITFADGTVDIFPSNAKVTA